MSWIRVLLVDDHACVRQGLKALIDGQQDIKVIGEAGNGREAIALCNTLRPDVVIMDISMPGLDGLSAAREIKSGNPDARILFLTVHENDAYFFEAIRAGADGYLPKSADSSDVLDGIRSVAEGRLHIQPSMAKWLVHEFLGHPAAREVSDTSDGLSSRERQVLQLVAEGLTNGEIARRLSLSVNTVRRHRANLMGKLGLHDRLGLLRYAMKKGWVPSLA